MEEGSIIKESIIEESTIKESIIEESTIGQEYITYKWLSKISSNIANLLNVPWPPSSNRNNRNTNNRNTRELMNALSRFYLSYYNAPNEQDILIEKFVDEIQNKHLLGNKSRNDVKNIFNSVTAEQIQQDIQNEGSLRLNVDINNEWVKFTYGTFSFQLLEGRFELLKDSNSNDVILKMLLRYNGLYPNSGTFWSIPPEVYLELSDRLESLLEDDPPIIECFAAPLNFNLSDYCSLFPDVDAPFGSIGNFFHIYPNFNPGLYFINPPYTERLIDASIAVALELLNKPGPWIFVFMLPNWHDLVSFELLKDSPYTKLIVNLQKNSFKVYDALQDKYIRGPFEISVIIASTVPIDNIVLFEQEIRTMFE